MNDKTRHALGTIGTMQKEIVTTTTQSKLPKLQSFNNKRTAALKNELSDIKSQFEVFKNNQNN